MGTKRIEIHHVREEIAHGLAFSRLDYWHRNNIPVREDKYVKVYECDVPKETTLEDLYMIFNVKHPEDYKAHSMSVSDVVVEYEDDGAKTAWFCDSFGFERIPDFFQSAEAAT